MSPGAAVSLVRMTLQMDVRDILPTIRVPTLVLHKRDDQVVPLEEGKYIADHIPGATFVELPGADHWPWIGHEEAVEEIQEFLTGMRDSAEPDRAVMTVMFIDIVDSTTRAARARGPAHGGTCSRASTRSSGASSTDTEDERSTRPATGSS